MNTYEQQAQDFANKYGLTLKVGTPKYKKHFADDTQERYVFPCTLQRNGEKYKFNFGQSIYNGDQEPTMYEVLSCLQKYDVGTFENFCDDFGYDCDSRKAEKIYNAVCKEYEALTRLFPEQEYDSEVWQELYDIQ